LLRLVGPPAEQKKQTVGYIVCCGEKRGGFGFNATSELLCRNLILVSGIPLRNISEGVYSPHPPSYLSIVCRKQLYSDGFEDLNQDKTLNPPDVGGNPNYNPAFLFDNNDKS